MPENSRLPSHGVVVEDRARRIAARLGLADFVYRPRLVARGKGNREPGDAPLAHVVKALNKSLAKTAAIDLGQPAAMG